MQFNVRAELFRQLGALEEAGLPTERALALTKLPPGPQSRLASMRRWLGLGLGIAEAGVRSGLFTPLEAALLQAACSAGSPARTYRRLADYCARRAAHLARMKSRMMLPLAMLLISDFVGPLPKVFAGTLTSGGYLLQCLLPLLALGALAYLYRELPRRLQPGSLALRKVRLNGMLPLAPWFGPMLVRRNVRDFFDSLALLLEAGMPILQALPIAEEAVRNEGIRRQFSQIKPRIEGGASLALAVSELSFPGRAQAHALILTGEAGGTLPEALFRYAESETEEINRFDDQVAEWTPRLVYTLSVLWIGYGILRSGAFMPSLPLDLR